jgi:dipeptidyl aminopeptidase/acylaminoacyl peptidase
LINSGRDTEALSNARKKFPTRVVNIDYLPEPIEKPDNSKFALIHYKSGANSLAAYVTPSPQDGAKHPAIIWIPGGHHNSIEDVWTPRERSNDQTASAFRKAGIVMMFASTRGGNDNPGSREGFFGEVDDILAAADHLANLPYVDPCSNLFRRAQYRGNTRHAGR